MFSQPSYGGRSGDSRHAYSALPQSSMASQARSVGIKEDAAEDDTSTSIVMDPDYVPPSVIQFNSSMYHVKEGQDREIKLEVMRIGQVSQSASVRYVTEDSTAKAGLKYVHTEGTLEFLPGQALNHFSVPIIDDPDWGTIAEFKVSLRNAKNGRLGMYLDTCRVKIIDDDAFPTNKYRDQVLGGSESIEEIWSLGLFVEFCRLLWSNKPTRRRILLFMLLDQLYSLYFFLTLYLQVYMIDVVLHPGSDEVPQGTTISRLLTEEAEGSEEGEMGFLYPTLFVRGSKFQTAIIVALLYFFPLFLLHIADLVKCSVLPQGDVRALIQENLLRKFLNYREEVHSAITVGETSMVMIRDVFEVVDMGIMKAMRICQIVGKLTLATVFLLAENRLAGIPLVIFPMVLMAWLRVREKTTHVVVHHMAEAQDKVMETLQNCVAKYRLIADFNMRPQMVHHFGLKLLEFHKRERALRAVLTNNMVVAPMMTGLLIGCYIIYGSVAVGSTLSLGAFIATINVFKEVGAEIKEIYLECMEVQRSFAPLKRVTDLMNRQDDAEARMKVMRARMAPLKHALSRTAEDTRLIVDELPIVLRGVTFAFPRSPPVLKKVSVEFSQGKLYGFVGPPHEGKATLLKILGSVILLDDEENGSCYIPSHLRALHCTLEPGLIPGTALENVVPNTTLDRVGGKDRVIKICERLQFPADLLKRLQNEQEFDHWRITQSGHARLGLARAFAMNPEVLIIHRPASVFNDADVVMINQLLREHVEARGIELPPWKEAMRRPRTVFISSQSMQGCACADKVFKVTRDGVQPIPKQPVTVILGGSDRTADMIS
mmetsp:Transcript_13112/g.29826  ORF Transcript_13112/g.29826 Transcript_13112/m.29826 type:complete len:826 (-) Transcript_13112:54-2531(-)